jgi:5'-nucleotidase
VLATTEGLYNAAAAAYGKQIAVPRIAGRHGLVKEAAGWAAYRGTLELAEQVLAEPLVKIVREAKPAEKPQPKIAEEPKMEKEPEPRAVQLALVHTGDAMGQDQFGAANLATIVQYLERQQEVILVDAGNTLHGSLAATLDMGASIIEVMNAVGYDLLVPGSYDFNFGRSRLEELAGMAEFPIVSANVAEADGELLLPPGGALVEADGVTVGLFGLTSQQTPKKTAVSNIAGLEFRDYFATAKEAVSRLQAAGADVIVAVSNIGLEELALSEADIAYAAEELKDIDVIVNGSTGMALADGYRVGDTLIVQTSAYNADIGVVELTVQDGAVTAAEHTLVTPEYAAELGVYPDAEVAQLMQDLAEKQQGVLQTVIAKHERSYSGEAEEAGRRLTNLGKLAADAVVEATGADFGLIPAGLLGGSLDAGETTAGELAAILPDDQRVVQLTISADELKALIEHGVAALPESSAAYPQLSGVRAIVSSAAQPGSRVFRLIVNNRAIDEQRSFTLATTAEVAAGAFGYDLLADNQIIGEYSTLLESVGLFLNQAYPVK